MNNQTSTLREVATAAVDFVRTIEAEDFDNIERFEKLLKDERFRVALQTIKLLRPENGVKVSLSTGPRKVRKTLEWEKPSKEDRARDSKTWRAHVDNTTLRVIRAFDPEEGIQYKAFLGPKMVGADRKLSVAQKLAVEELKKVAA